MEFSSLKFFFVKLKNIFLVIHTPYSWSFLLFLFTHKGIEVSHVCVKSSSKKKLFNKRVCLDMVLCL